MLIKYCVFSTILKYIPDSARLSSRCDGLSKGGGDVINGVREDMLSHLKLWNGYVGVVNAKNNSKSPTDFNHL